MNKYTFGVDIGGTTVKIGFFESDGTLLETWEIPTRTDNAGAAILSDIRDSILAKLEEKALSLENVKGIGLGVPGPVSSDGTVLKCVNLGWGVFNVEQTLSEMLGNVPVKAGNDANVAALGEMWKGGGKGFRNVVMLTLGTGVGGGIILDGKILAGANGAAGELGHIQAEDDDPETCGCGKHGCLEQYTSANGIVRITKRYLAAHPEAQSSLRDIPGYTSKEIFDAAKKGDETALAMVEETARILGKAIAGVSCVVDPEVFVLGGGMSKAGEILTTAIRKYYRKYAFHASTETPFKLAELGNLAGIYGCAKMVSD